MKTILMFAVAVLLTFGNASCGKDDTSTTDNNQITPANPTDPNNPSPTSGQWIALGLPSGLLWYSVNLGATAPEQYGDYYAWAETQPKNNYSWSNYKYATVDAVGDLQTFTKYNTSVDYGAVDNYITLQASDDAATAVLGNGARIPTLNEWRELLDNTSVQWATQNGVNGRRFTAANGNSIFLPAAGYRHSSELYVAGSDGCYWSASILETNPFYAWRMEFDSYDHKVFPGNRLYGQSVRAVRSQN